MFDLIPNLISAVISILVPVYFTYKALRTSSSPLLIPWLQYWSTFSLLLLLESYIPLLPWIPFYGTVRLLFLTYLVLPQTQGARYLYTAYIEPFFVEYENRIDHLIADTHDKLRASGLDYINQAIEWVKKNVLHIESQGPTRAQRPQPTTAESYVSNLLARFSSPQPPPPTAGSTNPAGDFYTLLSSAAATLGLNPSVTPSSASSRDAHIDSLLNTGALIPPHLNSLGERVDFVASQREKLRVLLGALDKEAGELDIQRDVEGRTAAGGVLPKSRSEPDFERVEKDEANNGGGEGVREVSGVDKGSGGWLGWLGSGGTGGGSTKSADKESGEIKSEGKSSGIET